MIPLKDQDLIRDKFARELFSPVRIDLFTQRELTLSIADQEPCASCKPTRELLQELSSLSDLLSLRVHIWKEASDEREALGIERVPGIALRGQSNAVFKFYGLPSGTAFPTFVETLTDLSFGETVMSPASIKTLRRLKGDVTVRLFVTPNCPYSPQMMRAVYHLALANPRVKAEVIEAGEFPQLAERYGVRAVPLAVIADTALVPGALSEDAFVEMVVKAAQSSPAAPPKTAGPTSQISLPSESPPQRGQQRDSGLIIP